MTSLPRSAAVLALLAATLAGCDGSGAGGGTGVRTPTPPLTTPLSATPANGNEISNDDFSYSVPDGWEGSDRSRAVSLAINTKDEDGFVDNLNVVRDNTVVGIEGAELEEAAKQILADASATRITINDPVQIDGEEAVHASAVFELGDPKYGIEQYVVRHDDTGYIVTLSFSPDVPRSERDAVSESILTTWKWQS